jgi:hypothetical protein
MKEEQVIKFIEKLDYSYEYKTVNERQNMIAELCLIAGIEQLTIPCVVGRSEQLVCSCGSIKVQTTGGSQCPNNRCSSAN